MDATFAESFSEVESLAREGAVAVVKVDGGRLLAGRPDIYTVVLSGGALGATESYRCDGDDLRQLLHDALAFYRASKT